MMMKKLLCSPCLQRECFAPHQLATLYNPITTNYVQDADSNDDTVATSNQLGREGADATNPDPEDDLDMSSDTSLKRHVLPEGMSDQD